MFPDYNGHSVANLIESIARACGRPASPLPPLTDLPVAELAAARHLVFVVVDGLGQKMLEQLPATSALRRHAIGTLTSVFPSTTASAIPTFMTAVTPAQHGLTGWHMYFEEIGETLAVLPMTPRGARGSGMAAATDADGWPARLFTAPPVYTQLGRESWVLAPQRIVGTPFNDWHARGANSLAYTSAAEMVSQITTLLIDAPCSRYIYAYFPELDSASHRYGSQGRETQAVLAEVDAAFGDLIEALAGCDAWLIASADHGFIDAPAAHQVSLDDHPELAALLARPLCGERRVAYCYVAPDNRPAFEAYCRTQLAHCAELHLSTDLIAAGRFGPPPVHPQLAARVGDYTLIMKDDWTLMDWLPGEKRYRQLGVHGGTSVDEMQVPLIALRV